MLVLMVLVQRRPIHASIKGPNVQDVEATQHLAFWFLEQSTVQVVLPGQKWAAKPIPK